MKKLCLLSISLGIVICMTSCGTSKNASKEVTQSQVNTTASSEDEVCSVHIENYTGVIVGVENKENNEVDKISTTDQLQIELLDSDEVIVCELLGPSTEYINLNGDGLKIGDTVNLDCEVDIKDGEIISRSVVSIKIVQEDENCF